MRLRLVVSICLGLALLAALRGAAPAQAQVGRYRVFLPIMVRLAPGYPAAPNLSASQPSSGVVVLSWTQAAAAEGYTLWQSSHANMGGAAAVYAGGERQRSLSLGAGAFYFRVQAVNDWGATASNIVAVTVQPPPPPLNCDVAGQSYGSLSFNGALTDRPAAAHADLNLSLRGAARVDEYRGLVDYNGGTDQGAPQLATLFLDNRTPSFPSVYKVYDWDWGGNRRGSLLTRWPVTLLGMGTTTGEIIRVPSSGYDIGSGYEVLVLYASDSRITLKYTREDNVVRGYTVHLENVCVEPRLLALYRNLSDRRQGRLPALRAGQAIGRSMGDQIAAAIRDSGTFMDPRSRKDWWIGRLKMTPEGWRLEFGD